ncbi:MAG: PAS domain S-box protein, partial [Anaerolineales bacterium]
MSATAYYNLTQGQRAVAEVTTENVMELSRSTAQRIEGLLVENQRTSATLAGEPLAAQFLAASEEERKGLAPQVHQMLQNFADTHPDYDAPGLLDANGFVVASLEELLLGKDRSFRDYFQASIQGQPYVSSMLVGRATGRPGVFLTNPVITAEGEIVGIDIVWLKGDTIWSIIDDVVVGEEGITYLVDQDGVIIAHPNRDLLYHSLGELTPEAATTISTTIRFGTVEGTDVPLIPESLGLDDLAAELASAQGSGTHRYDSPLDHRDHVAGYTRLEAYPWTVVVDLPEAQFLAPLQRLRSVAWVSVGVMGAITLLVSILLARTTTRPIRHLTDAAMAVERGQPFEPADIADVTAGRDEIAQLGRTFSSMVLALQQEITEHKQAEGALRESEAKYRTLVEQVPAVTYIAALDEASTTLYISPQVETLIGYSQAEYVADPDMWRERLHPYDRERVLAKVRRSHAIGEPFRSEYRMLARDGHVVWFRDDAVIVRDDAGQPLFLQGVMFDITERKRAEEELRKANRALRVLSECNQAVVRATEESDLLHQICRLIVEVGEYRLAWVGFAEQDKKKSVRPVAQTGFEEGYLETLNIIWADTERGRGPTGTAIRSGEYCTAKDIPTDPRFAPWREAAIQRGYASSVALPLIAEGQTFGALNIYAAEPDAFDADEVKLLTELADDLAYGVMALRT